MKMILVLLLCWVGFIGAAPVQWTIGSGGNGHYYEAVLASGTWETANAAAIAKGGYLASITSAAENNFAFSLVSGNTAFWYKDGANNTIGPWLGGYQPTGSAEPLGGWRWTTVEAFSYSNWSPGEPNNNAGFEDRIHFFGAGYLNIAQTWNDMPTSNADVRGYIIEYNTAVPEPQSLLLLGIVSLFGCFWRRFQS